MERRVGAVALKDGTWRGINGTLEIPTDVLGEFCGTGGSFKTESGKILRDRRRFRAALEGFQGALGGFQGTAEGSESESGKILRRRGKILGCPRIFLKNGGIWLGSRGSRAVGAGKEMWGARGTTR